MMLAIDALTVRYGQHVAVNNLGLSAEAGEVVAVLGPSGCGKSTLLRAIAGLEPYDGTIHLDGVDVARLRPDQRDVSLMFQDHALFPHKDVAGNVGFGARMAGLDRTAITKRVTEALNLVDLAGFEPRAVTELSGGEAQRVALARAVATRPALLLLDEPLGSLDRALRDRLVGELPQLFASVGSTVLYVTHDHDEALALADRTAVMRAGEFVQIDRPDRLWRTPKDRFVAGFLGLHRVLDIEVTGDAVHTPLGTVARGTLPATVPDGRSQLVLLPDALRIADSEPGHEPGHDIAVEASVTGRRFAGDHLVAQVNTDTLTGVTVPVWRGPGPEVGTRVRLWFNPVATHPLDAEPNAGMPDNAERPSK